VSVRTRVLDSWPVIEWISDRLPAADVVEALFLEAERGESRLFMSGVNMGEVYYYLAKRQTLAVAEEWRESLPSLPVTITAPNMEEIWSAALLKARYPISYADAFAAALAQKYDCPLITGDPEFRTVQGLRLDWIGP
jgi:uncharacterized protein